MFRVSLFILVLFSLTSLPVYAQNAEDGTVCATVEGKAGKSAGVSKNKGNKKRIRHFCNSSLKGKLSGNAAELDLSASVAKKKGFALGRASGNTVKSATSLKKHKSVSKVIKQPKKNFADSNGLVDTNTMGESFALDGKGSVKAAKVAPSVAATSASNPFNSNKSGLALVPESTGGGSFTEKK